MTDRKRSEALTQALHASAALDDRIRRVGLLALSADGGGFYPVDMLAIGALKRAISLSSAFRLVVENWNLTAARSLLRMQIDTACRFFALFLVDDPHEFSRQVLEGNRIDRMKDEDGNRLSDRYLVNRLGEQYEWIPRVYDRTCGYVHLSSLHITAGVTSSDDCTRSLDFCIGPQDLHMPDFSFMEAVECFNEATEILLNHVLGWAVTK